SLQQPFIDTNLYDPLFTRGSFLYPLINFQKKKAAVKLHTSFERLNFYADSSLSDELALQKIIDSQKDDSIIVKTFSDYSSDLTNLTTQLQSYFWESIIFCSASSSLNELSA